MMVEADDGKVATVENLKEEKLKFLGDGKIW